MSKTGGINTTQLNSELFFDQLDRLMGACIGVIAIRTREIERAKTLLHEWASMREMSFNVWTPISGFAKYKAIPVVKADSEGTERPAVQMGEDATDYLTPTEDMDLQTLPPEKAWDIFAQRQKNKDFTRNRFCGVFIGLTQDHLNMPSVQTHIRNHVQRAYQSDDRAIIILGPGQSLPDTVAGDVELIDLHTPSYAELLEVLDEMGVNIQDQLKTTLSKADQAVIVTNALGMTQQEFENAVSLAIVDLTRVVKLDPTHKVTADDFVKVVRERKLEILKTTQILELMPTAKLADVGGLDILKEYLNKRAKAYSPEARKFGIKPPKGILCVGPPGSGKSLICQVVCDILGQAGIRFDLSRVFGQYIGQSEERMRMALRMLEDMAPCVVHIDEIEKAVGNGGGGDGGTTSRVFGTLLTWMQDRSDREIPIFIVASANDVTKIPPELLRKGRFDAIFGLTFPTMDERMEIFKIHLRKRGHQLADNDIKTLAKLTDTYVGAEIESIIEEALFDDLNMGNKKITMDSLRHAIDSTTPQVKVFPERIAQMAEFVQKNARLASSEATFDITDSKEAPEGISKVQRGPRRAGLRLRSSNN